MTGSLINRALLLAATLSLIAAGPVQDRHLQSLIQPGVDRGYPGIAIIVRDHDGRIRMAGAGYSDLRHRTKMSPADAFHIGSVSKTFTGVVTLQLVDEGILSLTDTLARVLGPAVARIPNAEKITVSQLLDHSSGIYPINNDPDYLATLLGSKADPKRIWSFPEFVALADRGRQQPVGEPGQGHWYSDTNYILLGMIVEKVTGKPLRYSIESRIFRPLHMSHSYFYSDELRGAPVPKVRRTRGYLINTRDIASAITLSPKFPKAGTRSEGDVYDTTLAAERDDAAGGIITTLPDLELYADALFHGRLLSKSSQAVLASAEVGMNQFAVGKHRTWAMQAAHEPYGVVLYKEGDGSGGNTCLMSYVVAADEIFAGCTNSIGYFDEVDFMLDKVIPGTLNSTPP